VARHREVVGECVINVVAAEKGLHVGGVGWGGVHRALALVGACGVCVGAYIACGGIVARGQDNLKKSGPRPTEPPRVEYTSNANLQPTCVALR
jgi:hypothetical protein